MEENRKEHVERIVVEYMQRLGEKYPLHNTGPQNLSVYPFSGPRYFFSPLSIGCARIDLKIWDFDIPFKRVYVICELHYHLHEESEYVGKVSDLTPKNLDEVERIIQEAFTCFPAKIYFDSSRTYAMPQLFFTNEEAVHSALSFAGRMFLCAEPPIDVTILTRMIYSVVKRQFHVRNHYFEYIQSLCKTKNLHESVFEETKARIEKNVLAAKAIL